MWFPKLAYPPKGDSLWPLLISLLSNFLDLSYRQPLTFNKHHFWNPPLSGRVPAFWQSPRRSSCVVPVFSSHLQLSGVSQFPEGEWIGLAQPPTLRKCMFLWLDFPSRTKLLDQLNPRLPYDTDSFRWQSNQLKFLNTFSSMLFTIFHLSVLQEICTEDLLCSWCWA